MATEIPILYQDDHIIVVEKPPQVLVHPNPKDRISEDCITILSHVLKRQIFSVHRIDRGTSGIVAFALNPKAADGIARQFRDREIKKRYFAVVRGRLTEKVEVNKQVRRGADGEFVDAHSIVYPISTTTIYEQVGPYDEAWYSFVEIDLLTGRTHQARKHLKSLSCPVIGDNRNGDRTHNRFILERFGVPFMFLRSYSLHLLHPITGVALQATAGFPVWWIEAGKAMQLEVPQDLICEPQVTCNPA